VKVAEENDKISNQLDKFFSNLADNKDIITGSIDQLKESAAVANQKLEMACDALNKNSDIQASVTRNLSKVVKSFDKGENMQHTTNHGATYAKQQAQPSPTLEYTCETSNRFQALTDHSLERSTCSTSNSQTNDPTDAVDEAKSRKILLMGNSHIKHIKTNYFLQNCIVDNLSVFSFKEASDKLLEAAEDYECINVQFFTNDLRNSPPNECVNLCNQLIEDIKSHCPFAKIIISLPFPCLKNKPLNDKIATCNVLVQYEYLNTPSVSLCDNSGLSARGMPMKKFLANDGLHLNNQGMKVYVSNIKHCVRKCLGIDFDPSRSGHSRFGMGTRMTDGNQKNPRSGVDYSQPPGPRGRNSHRFPPPIVNPFYPGFNPDMFNLFQNWAPQQQKGKGFQF
jgi:hypothetical protein